MKYLFLFESFIEVEDISNAVKDALQDIVDDKGFSCETQVVNISMSEGGKMEKTLACIITKYSQEIERHRLYDDFQWDEVSNEIKFAIEYLQDSFELNDYEVSVYYKRRGIGDVMVKGDIEKVDPIMVSLQERGDEFEIKKVAIKLMFYVDNSGLFVRQ